VRIVSPSICLVLAVGVVPAYAVTKPSKSYTYLNQGLRFTENKGQTNKEALYTGDVGSGTRIYFKKNGVSYVMNRMKGDKESNESTTWEKDAKYHQLKTILSHRIDLKFENSNPNPVILAEDQAKDRTRYYLPKCESGLVVNSYLKLTYKEIYPNIDMVFQGGAKATMEYDFVLRPGADPSDIKISYAGADSLQMVPSPAGNGQTLLIKTSIGEIREYIPEAFQVMDGKKVNVKVDYRLSPVQNEITFQVSRYNPAYPLTIDPWITYYGGSDVDCGYGIANDNAGNSVITGQTNSPDFPVSPGAYQTTYAGANTSDDLFSFGDAFVVKFDVNGNRLWATYYGGSGWDVGNAIAIDNAGNIAITGSTNSPDFPVSAGAFQNVLKGTLGDAFAVKMDAGGNRLWATYYGGSGSNVLGFGDSGNGIATDNSGNIIIAGSTSSADFPVTPGAFQGTYAGGGGEGSLTYYYRGGDAFVVKFDANGNRLWGTFYGGLNDDGANGVVTDKSGNILFTGYTYSPDFPVSAGAFQGTYAGGKTQVGFGGGDAFAVKLDASGNQQWATYYGGSGWDGGNAIAIDHTGNIVFTGCTSSPDFPLSQGAFQTKFTADSSGYFGDAYLVKFNSGGSRIWATYFGAEDDNDDGGIAVDKNNNIYIFGGAENNNMLTTPCAFDSVYGGDEDFFLAKFDSTGNLSCSSYLGGSGYDDTYAIGYQMISQQGNYVNIVGGTNGNFPVTPGAYQTNFAGTEGFFSWSTFIVQLCANTCNMAVTSLSNGYTANQTSICVGTSVNFTSGAITSTTCSGSSSYSWKFQGGTPDTSSVPDPVGIAYNTPGSYDVSFILNTSCGIDTLIKKAYIQVYPPFSVAPLPDVTICQAGPAVLNPVVTGGGGAYTYQWSPVNLITGSVSVSPTVTTTYTLVVSSAYCGSTTNTVTVNVYSQPTAAYSYIPALPFIEDLVKFTDHSVNNIVSWQWNFGDNTTSILQNPQHTYPDTGMYTVRLVITDNNGCTDTTLQKIRVYIKFYIPNIFTPDNNGSNDVFKASGTNDLVQLSCVIFDRWGLEVYKWDGVSGGWDGRLPSGEQGSDGVYFYIFKTTDVQNKENQYTGFVQLIR